MKKVVLMLAAVAAISFTSCKNNKTSDKMSDNTAKSEEMAKNANDEKASKDDNATNKYPELTFDESSYDFGTIDEGEIVQHEFTFTNTGDAPLKVMKARPSCGCTVPSWSKDPIAPGEKGHMMVKFNSRGKHGKQNKTVRLTTNTKKGNEILRFTAMVNKK